MEELETELGELDHFVHDGTRIEILAWATNYKLDALSGSARRGSCLQALAGDFRQPHKQAGQEVGLVLCRDVFLLFRCTRKVVKPLKKSPACSPQLLVLDERGVQWRLHSGHRSITSLGAEVPFQALIWRIAFGTIKGWYVARSAEFEVLPFNLSIPSDIPDMLDLAQDKWFIRENPFGAEMGLYTEVEASQSSFLREWSLLSGTPSAGILESRNV